MYLNTAYQFLEYMKVVRGSSEHTLRNYAIDLNSFKQFWEEKELKLEEEAWLPKLNYELVGDKPKLKQGLPLKDINRSLIRDFIAAMYGAGLGRRTIVRRMSALKSFFKHAQKEGLLEKNPMQTIQRPKIERKVPASLSYEQIQHFFDQPDTGHYLGFRDRCILELFYSSGLRVSELCGLNRSDFCMERLQMLVRGKGSKERIVPITKNAAQWVEAYLNHPKRTVNTTEFLAQVDHDAIFLNKLGTRLSTRSVDRMFDKYLTLSGISSKVTPHTIRHTIATHWLENGMDLKTIQLLLGHSSLATTTIYTQVCSKLKEQTIDQYHPRS